MPSSLGGCPIIPGIEMKASATNRDNRKVPTRKEAPEDRFYADSFFIPRDKGVTLSPNVREGYPGKVEGCKGIFGRGDPGQPET